MWTVTCVQQPDGALHNLTEGVGTDEGDGTVTVSLGDVCATVEPGEPLVALVAEAPSTLAAAQVPSCPAHAGGLAARADHGYGRSGPRQPEGAAAWPRAISMLGVSASSLRV